MKNSFDTFVASLSRTSTPLRPTRSRRPRPRRRVSGFDRLEERALLSVSPLLITTGSVTVDGDAAGQDDGTVLSPIRASTQDLAAVNAIEDMTETLAPAVAVTATVAPALSVVPAIAVAAPLAPIIGTAPSATVDARVGEIQATVAAGPGRSSGSASVETPLSESSSVSVETSQARDDAAWSDGKLLDVLLEVRSDAASAEVGSKSSAVAVEAAAGSSAVGGAIGVTRKGERGVAQPGTDVVSPRRDGMPGVPAGEANPVVRRGEAGRDGAAVPASETPEGEITPDDLARVAFFGQAGQPAPDVMPRELPVLAFAAVTGGSILPNLQADGGPGGEVAPWLGYGVDPTITPNPGAPAEGGAAGAGAVEGGAAGAATARAEEPAEESGGLSASRIAEVFLVAAVWAARGRSRTRRSAVARLRRVWRRWRLGAW